MYREQVRSTGEALLFEQLAHQRQRRRSVAPALNQHVKDLALLELDARRE
jgi:hypothetical protein